MNICIVDDEQNCIDTLKGLLEKYASEHSISISFDTFDNGADFLDKYKPDYYDIVFLDIYIDTVTGMELAGAIRRQSENGMIIFCTTSVSDMPEAFRYHAFEYIIKPAEYPRIERIMDDAIAILPKLEQFIELPSGTGTGYAALSTIISVTTGGHYLDIMLGSGQVLTERMSLTAFTEQLKGDKRFLLINKGIMVNMDHISNIQDKVCIMDNDTRFPVKVRESASIKRYWQDYTFDKIRRGQAGL